MRNGSGVRGGERSGVRELSPKLFEAWDGGCCHVHQEQRSIPHQHYTASSKAGVFFLPFFKFFIFYPKSISLFLYTTFLLILNLDFKAPSHTRTHKSKRRDINEKNIK